MNRQLSSPPTNIVHWSIIVVVAALILAIVAIPALGEDPSATPGGSDGHLTGLSKNELTALLERYKAEKKFTADSVACFKGFVSLGKSGLGKEAGNRTVAEQAAVQANYPSEMRTWVAGCLKGKGWKNVGDAASADQFGKVEFVKPATAPVGKMGKAWAVEDGWISGVHEGSHAASRLADAKKLGLDFKKWQQWGPVKDKIDAMMADPSLSDRQALQAITDPEGFQETAGGQASGEGRYLADKARKELTKAELELAKWALANLEKFAKFYRVLLDPVRVASEEAREYAHQLTFINTRIATITMMLATRTSSGTPGTPETPGTPGTPETPGGSSVATGDDSVTNDRDSGIDFCFVPGTKVAMAHGSERNFEDIQASDRVRGHDGAVNIVTGIERPRLAGRLLYAIYGGPAFVTAEHPFWTADGWKAIDPTATAAENPSLRVAALVVGDRVSLAATPASGATAGARVLPVAYAPAQLQEVAIHAILGVTANPDTVVYNLLLDGNHTYFANGYLVHNKEAGGNAGNN